jgi:hypothetical protein
MTTFSFNESQYRFTNPIRFFKSNDPIYYEVENIPLKQLQENDMWLKDQIFNLKLTAEGGVERQTINELRPYSNGDDNIVRVKPGRFTARINDAYNLTPLQVLKNVVGNDEISEYNLWLAKSSRSSELSDVLGKFRSVITAQSINLNGLVERAFSWPARIPDRANTQFLSNENPIIVFLGGADASFGQPPYPGIGASLFANFFDPNGALPSEIPDDRGVDNISYDYIIRQYADGSPAIGFARLGAAETAFIKRWRGVARTAVVDVPEELTIEIPQFNPDDHFYINELGSKVNLPATQRIDLLFIYSKPVDAESATVAKYQGGVPTTITRAELGLVYGAGLGVNFTNLNSNKSVEVLSPANTPKGSYPNSIDSTLPDGTIKMLSHYGDETANNIGFSISGNLIKGSFPSPDDLMNLTPLLDEELTSSSLALIGQTILPIAYIVVRNNATLNSQGQRIIDPVNIIDIRPFFRTTELSYNERAGIAAAIPAPSLANPVVTQAELDYEIKRVYAELKTSTGGGGGTGGNTGSNTLNSIPRVVARGVVCGGLNFGVESVIDSIISDENSNLSQAQRLERIKTDYGYRNVNIPQRPAWDLARWCEIRSDLSSKGEYPNDYVNFHHFKIGNTGPIDSGGITTYRYAAWGNKEKNERLKRFGTQDADDYRFNEQGPGRVYTGKTDGHVTIYFVKKTILLDLNAVNGWMGDYDVNVQYLNCFPLTSNANANNGNGAPVSDEATPKSGNAAGIWVEKLPDRFTIFAAWAAKSPYWDTIDALGNPHTKPLLPPVNRNGNHFAGFGVVNNKLLTKNPRANATIASLAGEAEVGVAIYPTIQFQIIGIPTGFAGDNVGLDLTDPTSKLVLG